MKIRLLAVATVALVALGGCATYDYAAGSAPGGYYSGAPRVEYYGNYSYGYPYGGYGYYGYPYGYYGNPYGYYGYPNGYYRPPYHGHYPRPPRPDGDGGGPRPPHAWKPDKDRAPWRDLDRLGGQQGERPRQVAPHTSPAPRVAAPSRPAPAPRSSSNGGGRMTRAIEQARQLNDSP